MAPPSSPPVPASSRRSNRSRSPSHPPTTPPPEIDDPQLEQDLDAARQMSRARANSTSHRPYYATPASPGHGHGGHSASAAAAAAAAARFYMGHNRNGSNTSLDSASHFIDHRSQQMMPPNLSPGSLHGGAMRSSLGGGGPRRSQHRLDAVRTGQLIDVDNDDDDDDADAANQTNLRSYPTVSSTGEPGQGVHSSSFTMEQPQGRRLGAHDSSETPRTLSRRPSMAQDDVCFPMLTPGGEEVPGAPQSPYHDGGAHAHLHHHHHHEHVDPRQADMMPGFPFTFDLVTLQEYAEEERKRRGAATDIRSNRDARRRSQANADSRSGASAAAPGEGGGAAYGISPDSDDATFYSRRPRKFINMPGSGNDEGAANPRSKYQRKLALFEGAGQGPPPVGARASTIAGAGGGGTSGGGIFGGGDLMGQERDKHRSKATSNGFPVDTKTPLLDGQNGKSHDGNTLPSYHGTWNGGPAPDDEDLSRRLGRSLSVGAGLSSLSKPSGRRYGNRKLGRQESSFGPTSGLGEKAYRFTFYSNALPNTIHARHLYELPAPGQSFEELLLGESEATDVEGGDTSRSQAQQQQQQPRPAASGLSQALNGRLEGSTAPATGANTPELASAQAAQATREAGIAAAMERARAGPGGGIRMDQDPESNTWWLDVLCPSDAEMKMLSRAFGIHPLTTEDILMEETREKIELFRNYYLVCFRSFDQDPYSPTYLEPLNMYIIVFREGTLSFHFRATPHPQNVRRRIKQLKDYINVTSDWISYALIDDITDAFGPLIQSIEYEVDSIDELVLILKEAEQSDMLRRIGTCRKKVMGLLRLMGNKADVVKGLAKRCNENWSVAPKSDIGLYLSDIQDHLITMTQNLNHYEKILSRSHSNYLAQISIEMTDANNQINDVLSRLTALGTVIVPLNVITGLWGMNVHVPGQDVENLRWFFGIVAFMIALAVMGYFATIRYLSR
ncbi:cora-domain-containing protein [Acaromyces ingoldii]|uniref:Cora-domain-containing protein n=1 Tax=Acaromyces ingoldii TaxID=215250 RepID=A0A316YW42_9BASI|nr:cora-domain-containing protein [Acaromyces ingoldii]PWN92878.1 cora-domain-containing protein [Acaromyces ingoldii]